MLSASYLFFSLLVGSAFADNDWSKPCLSGVCEYDLPKSTGSASGTLKIWGPDNAISDITPAAGWKIIDCSPEALHQDVLLVCKDDKSGDCDHLYSGTTDNKDAIGKVVRLPENCGKSAFAVVTKAWTPEDQAIPAHIASSLTRRDGNTPTVRALRLETKFADVPSAGQVYFAIRAANVPGANGELDTSPHQQRRSNSRVFKRDSSAFVINAINDLASLEAWDINKSKDFSPLDIDKTFNLLDKSIHCSPVDARVKIDISAKAHATASIGVAASGAFFPPKISDFSLILGLNANLEGSIDLEATVSGTLDSGLIKLFEVGIPGLDFPGILSIGPTFQINGQATATLDLDAALSVGISYKIDNAQLTFPPKKSSSGSFKIGDTPLKLSASPSVQATGTVAAHLIPSLNFGVSALGGIVKAGVFLNLDASASMTLTAHAEAVATATITKSNSVKRDLTEHAARGLYVLSPASLNSRDGAVDASEDGTIKYSSTLEDRAEETSVDVWQKVSARDISSADVNYSDSATPKTGLTILGSASGSYGGCFEVDAALDVNAGADGSFFKLFDKGTKVALFSKKFELYKKCFGTNARRSLSEIALREPLGQSRPYNPSRLARSLLEPRGFSLTCPKASGGSRQSLVSQTVKAASLV